MKVKLTIVMAMVFGLSLGLAGIASAANQGGCGWCHGVMTNSATGNGAGKNVLTDTRDNVVTPVYESSLMPQADNGRGLHGIHMNYSSASYGGGTQTIKKPASGLTLSPYINAGAPGAITFLGGTTATVTSRGTCAYCHDNKHSNHESGFLQWSTISASYNTGYANTVGKVLTKGFMRYTSAGRGVSYKNNISSLVGPRVGNCTQACHKGTSAANPAAWGDYTTASVKLSCNSCHADLGGASGTEPALTGAHAAHLGSTAVVPSGTLMGAANNAGCVNCHPDNTAEGKSTKDWGPRLGQKAYPHATDGTNVVSDNVTLNGQITSATPSGLNTTCAAACHPRSNVITPALTWGGSMNCNMCHYYPGAGNTDTGSGLLPGAHELHITAGSITCNQCHPIPSDVAHATNLPVSSTGVTFVAGMGNVGTGLNVTCQNSCHAATSPSWNTTVSVTGCATCHEYPGAGAATSTGNPMVAGVDWSSTNGHSTRAASEQTANPNAAGSLKHLNIVAAYSKTADNYNVVTADPNKCGKCHSGATHMNGTNDVAAASSGPASGFTLTNHTNGSSAQCNNAKCHFGRTTPNWY